MVGIEAITDYNNHGCTAVSLGKQVVPVQEIWFIPFTHTYRFLTSHPGLLELLLYPGGTQIFLHMCTFRTMQFFKTSKTTILY